MPPGRPCELCELARTTRWYAEFDQPLPSDRPLSQRAMHEFLRWFAQPRLPHDRINNPLVDADFAHRVAGALRVYTGGLVQVLFPWRLSGDYSFQAEPVPTRLIFPRKTWWSPM